MYILHQLCIVAIQILIRAHHIKHNPSISDYYRLIDLSLQLDTHVHYLYTSTYVRGSFRSLPLFCFLVQFFDCLFDDVWPEVPLKVGDVSHAVAQLGRVLEQVL